MIQTRIPLGIDDEDVPEGSHICYLWETNEEFARAVGFLEEGLAGKSKRDHCVILGHSAANHRVGAVLESRGFDVEDLVAEERVTLLEGEGSGEAILAKIGNIFQGAMERGSDLIRLLGNIGWGRSGWPGDKELLRFESKVTEAAKMFPSVVLCMYDVSALRGQVLLHGAFQTHPLTFCGNLQRENPHHVPTEEFLERIEHVPD